MRNYDLNTTFAASDQLVNVLHAFGFNETTEKDFPNHTRDLKAAGKYDPFSVKRVFEKNRHEFYFNYINICYSNRYSYTHCKGDISIDELVSLLYFTDQSSQNRQYILDNVIQYDKLSNLYGKIKDFVDDELIADQRSMKKIKNMYQDLKSYKLKTIEIIEAQNADK